MPTVTLTFNLPDEQEEFSAATQGQAARLLLHEIDQHCRNKIKYTELSNETADALQQIRDMIHEDRDVTLE